MELRTRAKVKYCHSTEISICCRIYILQSQIDHHRPFGNLVSSLSLLTGRRLTPRIFLIKMGGYGKNSYLPSSNGCGVLLWAPAITWNGLWKWSSHKIFGKLILSTETEWRGMFISNRYKVSFVALCSFANQHRKNCKEISKQNNYRYQDWKNSSPHQSVHTPTPLPLYSKLNAPSPNRIDRATITTVTGAVIAYNFASYL